LVHEKLHGKDRRWMMRGKVFLVFFLLLGLAIAGFGENPCPSGWTLVPITSLAATRCADATGNAFRADVDQCGPDWITVEDGCFNHQPLCN